MWGLGGKLAAEELRLITPISNIDLKIDAHQIKSMFAEFRIIISGNICQLHNICKGDGEDYSRNVFEFTEEGLLSSSCVFI